MKDVTSQSPVNLETFTHLKKDTKLQASLSPANAAWHWSPN